MYNKHMRTEEWMKKEVIRNHSLNPSFIGFYPYFGLDESQAGIKIAGRNINNLRHADDTVAESEEELKSLLMRVKEESEKTGLKLNIQKTKTMASGPFVKSLSHVRLFVTPWTVAYLDFPGKSTGVGCHFLLQEIFLTQGLNPGLPRCRQMLYHLSHRRGNSGSRDRFYFTVDGD